MAADFYDPNYYLVHNIQILCQTEKCSFPLEPGSSFLTKVAEGFRNDEFLSVTPPCIATAVHKSEKLRHREIKAKATDRNHNFCITSDTPGPIIPRAFSISLSLTCRVKPPGNFCLKLSAFLHISPTTHVQKAQGTVADPSSFLLCLTEDARREIPILQLGLWLCFSRLFLVPAGSVHAH